MAKTITSNKQPAQPITLPDALCDFSDCNVWLNYCKLPDGNGHYSKPPIHPKKLCSVSVNDDTAWVTFNEANANVGKRTTVKFNGEYHDAEIAGVVIVLEPAGLVGIDIDGAITMGADGKLHATDECVQVATSFNSYVELSPSGEGVHIFCLGRKPGNAVSKVVSPAGTAIEMYDSGRCFTVTGRAMNCSKELRRNDEAVKMLYDSMVEWSRPAGGSSIRNIYEVQAAVKRPDLTDDDRAVIERMCGSKYGAKLKRLYDGDTSLNSGDDSRADMALMDNLAYWTRPNCNRAQMVRIFQNSKLYRPAKWTHVLSKASGITYGEALVAKATCKYVSQDSFKDEEGKIDFSALYAHINDNWRDYLHYDGAAKDSGALDWNDWI